ncbi:MAG: hypothetical protein KDA90_10415 [Planctomycetaceae bacterium]|nr:hypothetical protein [Planctomycetaceae bacterium]
MSARASAVAEILWELKRADKVAKFTDIAARAGFSAGANGRAMATCLKAVRRDWPHLEWWRAISDDATVKADGEQVGHVTAWGVATGEEKAGRLTLKLDDEQVMNWDEASSPSAVNG